jgi:anti-anti-sigma factor
MQIVKDQSGRFLTFVGKMDIRAVHEMRASLQASLEPATNLVVDLAQITACDTAAIQLLYSAKQTAERLGRSFEFAAISDVVRDASSLLGISFIAGSEDGAKQDAA